MNNRIKYPNFKLRLVLNLVIFMIFPVLITYFYLQDTKLLVRTTNEIMNHPYAVSNSVRDIDIYIYAMHRSMKDVVLARDEKSLAKAVELVDNYEKQVFLKFELVVERFLGSTDDVKNAYDSFVAWKPIREKVIDYVKAKQYEEAAFITQNEGADHISNLLKLTEIMINYADKKAQEYVAQSLKIQKAASRRTMTLLIGLMIVGIVLIVWSIRSITRPMASIISRVKELFENKLDNLSEGNNSTFYILDRVVSELENSERKARETIIIQTKELQEARNLLEKSIDTASTAMVMVFTDGKFKNVNEAFCTLSGYSREELTNLSFNDITHPDDKQIGNEFVKKILNGELDRSSLQKRYIKKSGEVILCSLSTSLVKSDESSEQYFFTQIVDITEQTRNRLLLNNYKNELEEKINARTRELKEKAKKLEKSQKALTFLLEDVNEVGNQLQLSNKMLLEANQELESFSYSVSHDLRAPLRAINGFTQILMEDYIEKLDDEGKRLGTVIQHNSRKMGILIDDLLAFSRLSRKNIEPSQINMTELAEEAVKELNDVEKDRKMGITIKQLPQVKGDRALLKQVFLNLLSNSIKFTRPMEKAEIEIGSLTKNHENIFYIKDNGVGFNMKYVDKIFDVFQRLHSEKDFEGTGVGLAIVQRIVNRHGGKVWAESKVNNGAIFYFSLTK